MKEDIPWIHLLRVIACIMVVCLHSLPYGSLTGTDNYFRYVVILLTRPCVPLFLMITGFLLLRNQSSDIDPIPFWKKRIPRIFFPLVVWGVVYSWIPYGVGITGIRDAMYSMILSPIRYPQEIGGILWYLFILLGIYLFLPFLSGRLFAERSIQKLYIGLWIMASFVVWLQCYDETILIGNPWYAPFDVFIYFSGMIGYLILGLFLGKINIRVPRLMLTFICLGGILISAAIIYFISNPVTGDYPLSFYSVPSIMMSACMWLIFRGGVLSSEIIKTISKYSFGIYLSHMVIFSVATKRLYEISTSPLMQLSVMILTFMGATVLTAIIYRLPYHKYTIGT